MKGVIVVLDGLGDLPHRKLKNKTPLEAARKPFLNKIAGNAELGYLYPINEKFVPESDKGTLHLLGREDTLISRGQLEARGAGIDLEEGDLALRANFATLHDFEEKRIVDRRVGRTLTGMEAQILAKAINKEVKLDHHFIFKHTVQHRGVLVLKGRFSENVSNTDPAYSQDGRIPPDILKDSEPLDEKDLSDYTSRLVNSFVYQSFKVLQKHPVNQKRRLGGELPANVILTRGAGTHLPKIKKFEKWAAIAYMPLEVGIAKTFGMKVFNFPLLERYHDYNNLKKLLKSAAKFAIQTLKKYSQEFRYFYIHFKETDIPGHDNLPGEKKEMIEILDQYFFSFLLKKQIEQQFTIVVTGDHATPCIKAGHSADPVPFLISEKFIKNKKINFCEKICLETKNKIYGKELLKRAGFG